MIRLSVRDADFEARFTALLSQARETTETVDRAVADIIAAVRASGDAAVIDYTTRFDRQTLTADRLRISSAEIDAATAAIPAELAAALDLAATRIEAFHRAQLPQDLRMTDEAGLTMGMRWTALDAVGLYVPGGKAAYPSSVLMNAIPARAAGVSRIAMCVPDAGRGAQSAGPRRRATRRHFRNLSDRRGASDRRLGVRHRVHRSRWIASSAPAMPMSPRPSVRCSGALASTTSPARRRWLCWPTPITIRAG